MKKNKIIIWESLPNIAGGQRVAFNIARHLKDRFHVSVIVPSEGRFSAELEKIGIASHYIKTGNYQLVKKGAGDILRFLFLTPIALWKSFWVVKEADLIFANSTRVFIWSAVIGSITGKPVIWYIHNILSDKKTKLLVEFFGRFRSVKKILADSHAAKDQYASLSKKAAVVYNGVDLSQYTMENCAQDQTHASGREMRIGVVGDIIPMKGHKVLISALNIIKAELPVRLIIIGAPQEHSRPYEGELKQLVVRLGMDKIVQFQGYCTDLPALLNTLDVIVIPSSSFESSPLAALEAFACGVPVIGSDLGGTPELIEEGRTGFVFHANDEKDLAEKIRLVLGNPPLHDEMRKNCRRIAEERFDLKMFSSKITSIIDGILEQKI